MVFWAFFQSTSWEQNDLVRVWATDIEAKQEWSVLRATVAGDSAYAINDLGGRIAEDRWVEYSGELSGNLPLNGTVSMSFGMYSDSSSVQVWFDHFRIQGLGPERHALFCQPDNCTRGSYRNYVPGSPGSQATCEMCPPGSIDDDANPATACTMCEAGRYSNSTTSCVACPGFPERATSQPSHRISFAWPPYRPAPSERRDLRECLTGLNLSRLVLGCLQGKILGL